MSTSEQTQTKEPIMDKYDKAVKYLTRNPKRIRIAWGDPSFEEGGCLFQFATKTGGPHVIKSGPHKGVHCGCLTSITAHPVRAQTSRLTEQIRSDARIPEDYMAITPDHLPVFADWQRKLDKELKRS